MYIEKIEWLDKESKEAVIKVADDTKCLICFSCPCFYNIGDVLTEPLECLDTNDIILCEKDNHSIEKMGELFKYKLKGKLKDIRNGIVEVYGFDIHINEKKIPGDITNGMCVEFIVSRIDIW